MCVQVTACPWMLTKLEIKVSCSGLEVCALYRSGGFGLTL